MLSTLRIRNLALIEEALLDLPPGFIAVTGETGAGKSILLGALNLLAGQRVDRTRLRQGAERCTVEGLLEATPTPAMQAWLEAQDLEPGDEGLPLRRSFTAQGSSRASLGGALATAAQLQEWGDFWIDFHDPQAPRGLGQERTQLALLDAYAGLSEARETFRAAYQAWKEKGAALTALRNRERLGPDQLAYLEQQLRLIDSIELDAAAIESLENRYTLQSRAVEIQQQCGQLVEGFLGDAGISAQLAQLLAPARNLGNLTGDLAALGARLEGLIIELEDLAEGYRQQAEAAGLDEEAPEALEQRMEQWLEVQRSYGRDLVQVREARARIAQEIEEQSDIDAALALGETELAAQETDLRTRAAALTQARCTAAQTLSAAVAERLTFLGFKHSHFSIEVIDDGALHPYGTSRCRFLFAPNAGLPPLPLNRIASGGEMARVFLALKVTLAENDATPVLVFDEIDANVGGEVARAVGVLLAELGKRHQVLCITHQPQVAALAPAHLLVTKEEHAGQTRVAIQSLHQDPEARRAELARMLGDRSSTSALEHASALLNGH